MASTNNQTQLQQQVKFVLLITLVLNIFVLILKLVVGIWTKSLSLQADALHSITDSANNVLGLITNHLSSPEPDRDHPYGHQKFEALGALGIAVLLGIACFEIIKAAIHRIQVGVHPLNIEGPELWILLIVLGVNIFVAFYERKAGQRLKSPMLIADAHHTMSDIWVTIAVLIGLISTWQYQTLHWQALLWLDVILSFPVALLVMVSAWKVLTFNLPWLVDEMAIAPELIYDIAMEVPGVINCHDIASRGLLGRQIFLEMHLVVSTMDVETAHDITELIEQKMTAKFGPVRANIHIEPPEYRSDRISFGE